MIIHFIALIIFALMVKYAHNEAQKEKQRSKSEPFYPICSETLYRMKQTEDLQDENHQTWNPKTERYEP